MANACHLKHVLQAVIDRFLTKEYRSRRTAKLLEEALEELYKVADRCETGLLKKEELAGVVQSAHERLEDLLPHDHEAYRLFEKSRENTKWYDEESEFVDESDKDYFRSQVGLIGEVITTWEKPQLVGIRKRKAQYYLSPSDPQRACASVAQVMSKAANKLMIEDPYLDTDVLDLVREVRPKVRIQLLCSCASRLTRVLQHLKATHRNTEGHISLEFHDRFILIDGKELWQIGCSFNGIGKSISSLIKIVEPDTRKSFRKKLETAWAQGRPHDQNCLEEHSLSRTRR